MSRNKAGIWEEQTLLRRIEDFNPWLTVGAALYWAAIVVQYLFPSAVGDRNVGGLLENYVLLSLFVGVGIACPRAVRTHRGRAIVSIAAVMAIVLALVLMHTRPLWLPLYNVLHMFSIAVLMVLWGFAFASMSKERAGTAVIAAMLLAVLLVLVLMRVPNGYMVGATRVCMVLSAAILASGRVDFVNRVRQPTATWASSMRLFVLSRVGCGLVLGVCIALPTRLAPEDADGALGVVALVIVVALALLYARGPNRLYLELPTLLLVSIALVYAPFFKEGLTGFVQASAAVGWLAWAEFSAFQLSDLKERAGVSEVLLCLVEKFVLSLSIGLGIAVAALVLEFLPTQHAIDLVILAEMSALVLTMAHGMGVLVNERKEDAARVELQRSRAERLGAVYDDLAREFGLSAREREVVEMLAEGYTRTYIGEALGVSDGTAKAHISHIYQKIGIHRKDDLLAFIEERLAEA